MCFSCCRRPVAPDPVFFEITNKTGKDLRIESIVFVMRDDLCRKSGVDSRGVALLNTAIKVDQTIALRRRNLGESFQNPAVEIGDLQTIIVDDNGKFCVLDWEITNRMIILPTNLG